MTSVLYGTHGGFGSTDTNLYTIAGDMSLTAVGETGHLFTGLAFDPTDGTLYGVTGNVGANQRTLFTIDPLTGAATLIGALGSTCADICFDADGVLYGWKPAGASGGNNRLTVIDKATGARTDFGASGAGSTNGCGLACDADGLLWMFPTGSGGDVFTVDKATGIATEVGFIFPDIFPPYSSTVAAAAFGPEGVLYALCADSPSAIFTLGAPSVDDEYPAALVGEIPGDPETYEIWDGMAWLVDGGGAEVPPPGVIENQRIYAFALEIADDGIEAVVGIRTTIGES